MNPGAYRCVCVEFKAHHRGVRGANAHLLDDLEQGALLGYDDRGAAKEATRAATAAFGAGTRRPGRFGCCAGS